MVPRPRSRFFVPEETHSMFPKAITQAVLRERKKKARPTIKCRGLKANHHRLTINHGPLLLHHEPLMLNHFDRLIGVPIGGRSTSSSQVGGCSFLTSGVPSIQREAPSTAGILRILSAHGLVLRVGVGSGGARTLMWPTNCIKVQTPQNTALALHRVADAAVFQQPHPQRSPFPFGKGPDMCTREGCTYTHVYAYTYTRMHALVHG